MRTLKLCLCFFILFILTACSDGELKNLTSFIDSYNHFADNKLDIEDFFFIDGSEDTLRAFISGNECQVILSLKEDNNSKIESIKLTLPKNDVTQPKKEECDFFCKALTNSLMAYCMFSP